MVPRCPSRALVGCIFLLRMSESTMNSKHNNIMILIKMRLGSPLGTAKAVFEQQSC